MIRRITAVAAALHRRQDDHERNPDTRGAYADQAPESRVGARMAPGKREIVRVVNERIRLVSEPFTHASDGRPFTDLVCKCGNESCFAVVPMTVPEWDTATIQAGYFIVRPEHLATGEQAIVSTDRYAIVRSARPGEPTHRRTEAEAPRPT